MIVYTTATPQNVRSGPGTNFGIVTTAMPSNPIEIQDVYSCLLGKDGAWVQVKVKGLTGWMACWYLVQKSNTWEYGHGLTGLHGPADPGKWAWDEIAYQVLSDAKIQTVKILCADDIDASVVNRLTSQGIVVVARLFNKIYSKMSATQYMSEILEPTTRLYNAGVRYFEVHNEPNLYTSAAPEGMGVSWTHGGTGPDGFSTWFTEAINYLKPKFPEAKFGFPAVSPGDAIPNFRYDPIKFINEADLSNADWIAYHVYWLGDNDVASALSSIDSFARKYPNKTVLVTEFSNTNVNTSKDKKGEQYKEFYTKAKNLPSNVGALYSYCLSASSGFEHETWKYSSIPTIVGSR